MLRAKSNKTNNQLSSLKNSYWRKISRNWVLYLFLLPTFAYIIAFCYVPMYGIQIAFKDFSISKGFWDSPWVGLKWFEKFFGSPKFFSLLKNTLTLSIYNLIVGFPLPIIMAVMLHNLRNEKWKKFAQTITYMPHFISTVILVSIISIMFSPRTGIINTILGYLGGSGTTYFMGNASYFPHLYTWSGIWQETGWGTIIYLAALSGVDPSLHEAAEIDGASKLQRIYHIDIPSIIPTIIIMLILRCGSIMGVGYEKAFLMQNSLNIATSEIISTYTYKAGLIQKSYSFSTAVGLFNNIVNFALLTTVNKITKKLGGSTLW